MIIFFLDCIFFTYPFILIINETGNFFYRTNFSEIPIIVLIGISIAIPIITFFSSLKLKALIKRKFKMKGIELLTFNIFQVIILNIIYFILKLLF